jgi:hypothetical protein
LSGWFKDLVLSVKAKERLKSRASIGTEHLIKLNKQQIQKAQQRAKDNFLRGKDAIKELDQNSLLVTGIALYWAEGYKRLQIKDGRELTSHRICFVNSDAEMTRVFIRFLIEILNIQIGEILVTMRLYPHINEKDAFRFWMDATGLPKEQFYKTSYHVSGASKGIRPYNRLPRGTLQIDVCDTAKFHYLLGLIQGVKDQFNCDIMPSLPG